MRRCGSVTCLSPTPPRCLSRITTAISRRPASAPKNPRCCEAGHNLVEAFLSGQVNVVHLLSPMTVWARYGSQAPAKVVAWNHVNGSAYYGRARDQQLGDLGGKIVAVPFWYSIHNVVLQDMLRAQGLDAGAQENPAPKPERSHLIVMSPSDMPPALAARTRSRGSSSPSRSMPPPKRSASARSCALPATSGRITPAASSSCTSRT